MSTRALLVALAGLTLAALGCSPNPPTDGLFGCATGGCPASHPYCHSDDRCYAAAETDAGPRPDAYTPDAPGAAIAELGACMATTQCQPGLECLGGACMIRCMPGTACPGGRECAPAPGGGGVGACVFPCIRGGCSDHPMTLPRGMAPCRCFPLSWP